MFAARMLAAPLARKLYHSVKRVSGLRPLVVSAPVSVISKLVTFWHRVVIADALEALLVATLYSCTFHRCLLYGYWAAVFRRYIVRGLDVR